MGKKKQLGECCPVMSMVLARDNHGKTKPTGFTVGITFRLNGKAGKRRLIYEFSKAKKTDVSEYGASSEYASATYAPVKHCPFCGESVGAASATGSGS